MVLMISSISFPVCGFHSVFPLMDKDKRLVGAFCWERLTVGEGLGEGLFSVNL